MAGLLTLVAVYSIFLGPVFEMYVVYTACSGKNIVHVFALTGEMRMDITIKLKVNQSITVVL